MLAPNPHNQLQPRHRNPRGLAHCRPVKALNRDGKVVGEFPSVQEAADVLGVCRNAIVQALTWHSKSGGHFWRFAAESGDWRPNRSRAQRNRGPRRPIPKQYRPGGDPLAKPLVRTAVPRGVVVLASPKPERPLPSWKFGEHFADTADSVGSIAPDVVLDERLNPARFGDDPGNIERVRFNRARQYNPALTWPEWVELTTRKPMGRKPGTKLARKATR